MSASLPVCLVIPAYNEHRTIRSIVERALSLDVAVIVVDDGSTDGTAEALAGLPLTVLRNPHNLGKGGSLLRGLQQALLDGAQTVITLDGDGQHMPEDISRLIDAGGPDRVVIGARLRNTENAPKARLRANKFADFWVSWAAGRRIRDSQSGYRLYPAAAVERLVGGALRGGFVFESEALIELGRSGFRFRTVPIDSIYLKGARASHFRPVVDITRIVLMIAWKLITYGLYLPGLVRALRES